MAAPVFPYIQVGSITPSIAKAAKIQAGDIYVSVNQIKHIAGKHTTEINQVGMRVIDYIRFVCQNFNQIRKAQRNSILLVVYNNALPHTAAIDLNFALDIKKGFWEIKTAEPRRISTVENKTLIWEAAKHTSNSHSPAPIR